MKLMDRTLGKNVGVVRTCYWVGRGPHPAGPGQGGESGEKLYFNESFHQHTLLCAEQNDDECGDNVANHQPYL